MSLPGTTFIPKTLKENQYFTIIQTGVSSSIFANVNWKLNDARPCTFNYIWSTTGRLLF